jgi:Ribophorin I
VHTHPPLVTCLVDCIPGCAQVILPEGATDVRWSIPFELDEVSHTRRATYLDSPLMGGRPVLVMRKRNVVREHNVNFKVGGWAAACVRRRS